MIKMTLPPSRMARAARLAVVPVPKTPRSNPLHAAAASLRNQLDSLASNTLATPLERQRMAKVLLDAHRKRLGDIAAKAQRDYDDLIETCSRLTAKVVQVEENLTPLALRRLEAVARSIAKLAPPEMARDFASAVDRRDVSRLLAYSLLEPQANGWRDALAVIVGPDEWVFAVTQGPEITSVLAAVRGHQEGFEQLVVSESPADQPDPFSPSEMIEIGNMGPAAIGGRVTLPPNIPTHLTERITEKALSGPRSSPNAEAVWASRLGVSHVAAEVEPVPAEVTADDGGNAA
ncbi:MAG: hypothetical protein KDC98_10015 [Planctomycetes bacterium]|nr:hypothetical protein [Planctomycetota bacterium]